MSPLISETFPESVSIYEIERLEQYFACKSPMMLEEQEATSVPCAISPVIYEVFLATASISEAKED